MALDNPIYIHHTKSILYWWLPDNSRINKALTYWWVKERGGAKRWFWLLRNGVVLEMHNCSHDCTDTEWYVPSRPQEKAAIINAGGIIAKFLVTYKNKKRK